ncbi:FGGY-family carbohydrate kinase [Thermoanaerobacterium thermosulfurigenes]|uniref:FGGY-family carbohydrate kinase n=1 Tax=Thermoanaerobacterium thermosulfurigenes TaxID=33950 RepID=UPI003EF50666
MQYILSLDFGTSSLKASILNEKLETIKSIKEEYQFEVLNDDKIELNPDELFKAFVKCTHKLNDFMPKVDMLVYDTFSPSVIFMDASGDYLYPVITHLDRRSLNQSNEILKYFGEDRYQEITGVLPFAGGVSLTSILWIKENIPEVFSKAYKIAHFNTYFYRKLTGFWGIDHVNASMTGIYETVKDSGWSDDICETFGINKGKLPDVIYAGNVYGHLRKNISELTGLKEGIPVAFGTNDAAISQIGAGNSNSGDILNISGSSEILSIITDRPILGKKYYIRKAVSPGKWQVFSIVTGGFAIEWFRKEFFREIDKDKFYGDYLEKLIKKNCKNIEVEFSPYLTGDRHSLIKKRGSFSGLTLSTTRDDMLLSILYGIHKPILEVFNLASSFLKLNNTIKITGGLSSNPSIVDLKRNIFKNYNFQVVNDCSIIGNAKLALQSNKK